MANRTLLLAGTAIASLTGMPAAAQSAPARPAPMARDYSIAPGAMKAALDAWVIAYNTDFPHQSLTYKTPAQFNSGFVQKRTARKEARTQNYSLSFS